MIEDFKHLPQMFLEEFERKVLELNLHVIYLLIIKIDINNYLMSKTESDYRTICSKLVTSNQEGICNYFYK
jgi:hypothetical protein